MQRATRLARGERRRDPARILCAFSRHRASARIILNDGYTFSRCSRCNADLVQVEGAWAAAPHGYRIVWKSDTIPVRAEEEVPATAGPFPAPPAEEAVAAEEAAAFPEAAEEPVSEENPEPSFPERRRLDRRVNPYAFAYKGKERRRNRDRRNHFGRKAEAV